MSGVLPGPGEHFGEPAPSSRAVAAAADCCTRIAIAVRFGCRPEQARPSGNGRPGHSRHPVRVRPEVNPRTVGVICAPNSAIATGKGPPAPAAPQHADDGGARVGQRFGAAAPAARAARGLRAPRALTDRSSHATRWPERCRGQQPAWRPRPTLAYSLQSSRPDSGWLVCVTGSGSTGPSDRGSIPTRTDPLNRGSGPSKIGPFGWGSGPPGNRTPRMGVRTLEKRTLRQGVRTLENRTLRQGVRTPENRTL